jgi:hypothetical protein
LYQASIRPSPAELPGQGGQWQHTPYGRIFVGLLLAQGLYHGLQQLCTAGLLAVSSESSREVWATLFGLVLQQGLQGFALLVGGILAGSGQRRGMLIGTVLGILNCCVLLVIDRFGPKQLTPYGVVGDAHSFTIVAGYGQPLLLTAFGAVGGLIGSLIWKPLPTLTVPTENGGKKAGVDLSQPKRPHLLAGQVAWVRVALAIAMVVAGNIWANVILKFLLDSSEGKLTISSRLQAQLVTMEICALAALIGSSFAGATTTNGLKQGLVVGVGATSILLGIQLGGTLPVADKMIYTGLSTMALALAGGWFGGHLFPPILGRSRRRVHAPQFQ